MAGCCGQNRRPVQERQDVEYVLVRDGHEDRVFGSRLEADAARIRDGGYGRVQVRNKT